MVDRQGKTVVICVNISFYSLQPNDLKPSSTWVHPWFL